MLLSKTDLKLDSFFVNGSSLVANVIYEAIKCRTYPVLPRHIDSIVTWVTDIYENEFERITDTFYLKEFKTYHDLQKWLELYIKPIPAIQDLNLSQKEYDDDISVDDPDRPKYVFTSAFSKAIALKDDFVDLDAFIGNLTQDLIRENIEIDFSTF